MKQPSFTDESSLIHRMDPRFRVVIAMLYTMLIAVSNEFTTLFFCLLLSILLVMVTRLQVFQVGKRLLLVNGMILLFWVILPLTTAGESLALLGPVSLSKQGIMLAARLTLKSNSILLALIALVATCPITTVGFAMKSLGIPEKLVYLFLITCRYLFELEQEYQRLIMAAKIRCFRPGNNLHTYRTFAYLIGMLFVRASVRGERVYQAMCCRGFNGRLYILHDFKASVTDWIFLSGSALLITTLGILEWGMLPY